MSVLRQLYFSASRTRIHVHLHAHTREGLAAAMLVIALAAPAAAQSRMTFINGNELHEMCQIDWPRCEGFIWGVADAFEATA
jgi:hypothetical protein